MRRKNKTEQTPFLEKAIRFLEWVQMRKEEKKRRDLIQKESKEKEPEDDCGFVFPLVENKARSNKPKSKLTLDDLKFSDPDLPEPFGNDEQNDPEEVEEIDLSNGKGLPIKLLKAEKGNRLRWLELRKKYMAEDVYESVHFPLSTKNIPQNTAIPFEHMETPCNLIFNEKTTIVSSGGEVSELIIKRPLVYYRFESEPERFPCECLCAVDRKNYELFLPFENLEKRADRIATFAKLSGAQREFIFKMANRPIQADEDKRSSAEAFSPIRDISSLEMMYEICKHTYQPAVRARIESLKAQLQNAHGADRMDLINQLGFAIGIDTQARKRPKRTYEECMAIMDKHIYGLREVKENVVEFIIAMQESGAASFRMLLVGPPGVGKTSFTDAIAECLGDDMPILHIDCSGVNTITMAGLIKSYSGAKAGKVMDGFFGLGQTDVLALFDELDKMAADKDGDPYGALIKPLGPQKKFYDEYVADDTDVSATKFIATANDISKIPGYILSRFENNIFYLNAYSKEEKLEIAQKHILPKKFSEFNLKPEDCVFGQDALEGIIDRYCSDEGVRELEGNVTLLMRKIITEQSRGLISFPFHVDFEYVESHLKKKSVGEPKRKVGY